MTLSEMREYLIHALIAENQQYRSTPVPPDSAGQDRLLRELFNVRPPIPPTDDAFFEVQDAYLQAVMAQKSIVDVWMLSPTPSDSRLCVWQGDITTIQADAIVNAANSALLGCFSPNHGCIDNAIHTFAGAQLRLNCHWTMKAQGHPEEPGRAKITPGYNLPAGYVLHTVGPIIRGALTERDRELLASCYTSCLELAAHSELASVVFCCISTGEFHFPQEEAAPIAVSAVKSFLRRDTSIERVVFNVFKDADLDIYRRILG